MSMSRTVLAAVAAALVTACGGGGEAPGDRTPHEELNIAADTAEGFGTERPAGVTPVQGGATVGGPLTVTGNLRGSDPSAPPPGSVTITADGDGSRLLVSIQQFTSGARVQAIIVNARCGERGQRVYTAPDAVTIGEEGIATFEGRIPIATEQLLDGRHSVRLGTPRGEGSADVDLACADLPRTNAAPVR